MAENKSAVDFLKMTPLDEARRYCFHAGWHHQGDTRAMLGNGGFLELPEVMVAFYDQLIKERDHYRDLALESLDTRLPNPAMIIVHDAERAAALEALWSATKADWPGGYSADFTAAVQRLKKLEETVTIYLTHMLPCIILFLAVTGLFAIFLLSPNRAYAKSGIGTRYGVTRNTSLTKAPDKRRQWLEARVNLPLATAQGSSPLLNSKARSCMRSKSAPAMKAQPSASCLKTERISALTLIWESQSGQNYRVSKPENMSHLNDGDRFTVSDLSNIKPEPAERRVLPYSGDVAGLVCCVVKAASVKIVIPSKDAANVRLVLFPEHVNIRNLPIEIQKKCLIFKGCNVTFLWNSGKGSLQGKFLIREKYYWANVFRVWVGELIHRSCGYMNPDFCSGLEGESFPAVPYQDSSNNLFFSSEREIEGHRFRAYPSALIQLRLCNGGFEGLFCLDSASLGLIGSVTRSLGSSLGSSGSPISSAINKNRCDGIDYESNQSQQRQKKIAILIAALCVVGGFFISLYALRKIQNGANFWGFVCVTLGGLSSFIYGFAMFLKIIVE